MKNLYIKREIEPLFMRHLKSFPVVAVSGARQTGKTTLIKHILKDSHDFVSMDDLNIRNSAVHDPKRFVESLKDNTIIDEIQYAPDMLSYIKMRVDENRDKRGNFVLTGSQQFLMMKGLSETLAGRVGILNLYPMSVSETEHGILNTMSVFTRYCLISSYPEPLLKPDVDTVLWYNNYINTYIEKDVKSLFNVEHASEFSVFIKLLALRASQMLNMSTLASETRVTVPTIKKWLSILEASNIIFFLRPYHANLKKRLVKTPKVYFYDTAMVCRMCGIESEKSLFQHAMLGAIFENFCVSEAKKTVQNCGIQANINYIRTKSGLETDLVVEESGRFSLFEMKASKSIGAKAAENIVESRDSIIPKGKTDNTFVVSLNDIEGHLSKDVYFCGLEKMLKILTSNR